MDITMPNSKDDSQMRASGIQVHRHCQKTVCSAYGQGGQGATWNIISALQLGHLPEEWKDSFMGNENNITQDLASILKLIDNVAGIMSDSISGSLSTKNLKVNIGTANISNVPVTMPSDVTVTIPEKTLTIKRPNWEQNRRTEEELLSIPIATSASSVPIVDVSQDYLYAPSRSNHWTSETGGVIEYALSRAYNFYKLWGPGIENEEDIVREIRFNLEEETRDIRSTAPFIWYFSVHNGLSNGTFTWKINVSHTDKENNFLHFTDSDGNVTTEGHITTTDIQSGQTYTTSWPAERNIYASTFTYDGTYFIFTIQPHRSETYRFFCDRTHGPNHVSISRFSVF